MSKWNKLIARVALVFLVAVHFAAYPAFFPPKLEGANMTSVSDTLSNNRLSFRGQLNGAMAANAGVVTLETTPGSMSSENTSTGSAALMENESVKVGLNAPIAIKTIDTAARVVLASGLTTAAADEDPVVATVSAVHTVKFTPVSVVAAGAFRVLIPRGTTDGNDGLPDKDGFDLNALSSVTCTGGNNMTFETGTATEAAITVGATTFHAFECRYSGTGASPAAVTMTIGTAGTNKLINPAPSAATGRTPGPGGAETYTFRARHIYGTDQSYATVDETLGTIGVVEAVRVTATVPPTLTFQITGLASGTSACGNSTDQTTTYNTAPFGSISTTAFTDLAQLLVVSTNASSGYTVTASESAALTANNVSGTPTIADTACDTTCTVTTAADWNTATTKGFGYSLQDINGDAVTAALEYDYNPGTPRVFNARPFGITGHSIMSDTAAVDSDQAYVCYRTIVSGTQQAGDYENYVTFIATATF